MNFVAKIGWSHCEVVAVGVLAGLGAFHERAVWARRRNAGER